MLAGGSVLHTNVHAKREREKKLLIKGERFARISPLTRYSAGEWVGEGRKGPIDSRAEERGEKK